MNAFFRRTDRAAVALRALERLLPLRRLLALGAALKADWRRMQHARTCQRALHELDDATLRDLGLHRSEIGSLGAELAGAATTTRVWALSRRPA